MMLPIFLLFVCASALAATDEKLQQAKQLMGSSVYIQPYKQQLKKALDAKSRLESRLVILCPSWDIRQPQIHFVILTSVLHDVALKLGGNNVDDETYHKIFADSVKEVVPQAWVDPLEYEWKVVNSLNKIVASMKDLLNIIKTQCEDIKYDDLCNALVYLKIHFSSSDVQKQLYIQAETLRRLAGTGREYIKLENTFWNVAVAHSEVSYLLNESNMNAVKQMVDYTALIAASVSSAGIPDMPRLVKDQCN